MGTSTAQKMKFSIKDFFSKCDQIRRKMKKFLMENFVFCAVKNTKKTTKEYVNCKKQQNIYRRFADLMKNVEIAKFCTKSTIRVGTFTSRGIHVQYNAMETSRRISKERKRLLEGQFQKTSPEIYDKITPALMRKGALKTKSATEPSYFHGDDQRQIIGTNT